MTNCRSISRDVMRCDNSRQTSCSRAVNRNWEAKLSQASERAAHVSSDEDRSATTDYIAASRTLERTEGLSSFARCTPQAENRSLLGTNSSTNSSTITAVSTMRATNVWSEPI